MEICFVTVRSSALALAAIVFGASFSAPIAAADAIATETLVAQAAPSDAELEKFALALRDVFVIRQELEQKAANAVVETGLDPQRFSEIARALGESNGAENADASEEELEQFEQARQEIRQLAESTDAEMREAVTAQGLGLDRYQEIGAAVEESPELQQEVRDIIQTTTDQ